jgi:hypothetical protein
MAFVGSLSGSGGASNTINVTGSMIIANPGTGGLFPAFPGTDTVFFVSGAVGGKAAGSRTVSVFGGDTVVSGSITIGTGSIRIDSNEIRFQGGAAKITSGSGGLTFFDSGTPSGVTLTTLAAGAAGGDVDGPADSTDNSIARFDGTTGKLLTGSAVTIGDETGGGITIAGSATATTITLFNTDATTVNFAGGATAATNIGNASGLTTIAGNLKVAGNNIQSSTGATAITLSGGNVIIPGDLTVNGTTLTVDATTVSIEDPVIGFGFTSGSATRGAPGDRGFIGGLDGENNVAMIWDESADGFGVFRTTSSTTSSLPVDVVDYSTFRAGKLELGGSTAFITSSDGNVLSAVAGGDLFLNAAAGPAGSNGNVVFEVAGTDYLQVSGSGGNTVEIKSPGGLVNSASIFASNVGLISFAGQTTALTMGANSDAATTTIRTGNILGTRSIQNLFNTTATTVNFAGGASTALIMGNSGGSNQISGQTKFNQGLSGSLTKLSDGTSYLIAGTNVTITTGSSGAVTISTSGGGDVTGPASSTDTAIARFNGLTGKIIQNTAGVTIDGSNNVVTSGSFSVKDGAGTVLAVIKNTGEITGSNALLSGDFAVNGGDITTTAVTFNLIDATATTVNFARAATTLTAGASGGSTTFQGNLTGSNVLVNNTLNVVQTANFGGGYNDTGLTINSAGNLATNGTLLVEGTTTLSGSVFLGDASGDDLTFNGYAASSLIPKTTNSFDLGTPDLRWRNMYTGDLHLKNERGDWTVIEEEEFLTLTNNKSGKRYKFVLEEI